MTNNEFRWRRVNSIEEMRDYYLRVIPTVREAARECGYAIGVHGSLMGDMDIIAAPWIEDCSNRDELASRIHLAASGGIDYPRYSWESKPRGRVATSFPICWTDMPKLIPGMCHIDLSIVGTSE